MIKMVATSDSRRLAESRCLKQTCHLYDLKVETRTRVCRREKRGRGAAVGSPRPRQPSTPALFPLLPLAGRHVCIGRAHTLADSRGFLSPGPSRPRRSKQPEPSGFALAAFLSQDAPSLPIGRRAAASQPAPRAPECTARPPSSLCRHPRRPLPALNLQP